MKDKNSDTAPGFLHTRKYRLFIIFAFLGVAMLFVFVCLTFKSGREDVLYIAAVGPMSGKEKAAGEEILRGINLCLDQVNKEGGINGKRIALLVFDDQNDTEAAREKALEIVKQNKALIVLGHNLSSTSVVGGKVYKEAGITAISGSATAENVTEENEWFFRVIFDNRSQSVFVANYVKRVLNQKTASIIFDEDSYGTTLAKTFERMFRGLGGDIKYIWSFDSSAEDLETGLDQIITDLLKARSDNPGIIFMATQGTEAVKLITSMRRRGLKYPVIGGDALGSQDFISEFNAYPEEQATPGYFSDGIYATSPIIFDVAGGKAQKFHDKFLEKYRKEPNWSAATYYDATLVAVEAMRRTGVLGQPENLAKERKKIKEFLTSSNNIEDAITEGLTGHIYFDKHGNVVKPVTIGVFAKQHFISALTQLQPIPDINLVDDLDAELEAGNVLIVGGKYMYKTNIVYVGVDFNEVRDIDIKNSTYTLDFYLWFRYQGQLGADKVQFINSAKPISLGQPVAEEETLGGVNYRTYRVVDRFKGNFDFHDYPFDSQQLILKFRHVNATRDTLIYVVDVVGMRNTISKAMLERFNRTGVLKSLAGWRGIGVNAFQDIFLTDSTLGNPRLFDLDTKTEYSRFNLFIEIKRDALDFVIKSMLPLLIVLGLAYLAFYLPLGHSSRLGVGTSALLTTAFFHFGLANSLPQIGYTVAIEYFFYTAYMLATVLVVFETASLKLENIENATDDEAKKEKILKMRLYLNLFGKALYPAIMVAVVVWFTLRFDVLPWSFYQKEPGTKTSTLNSATPGTVSPQPLETGENNAGAEEVVLTLGSWRSDDIEQMNRLLTVFNTKHPRITVKFNPTSATEYNSVLQTQLENRIGPDLFYIRSFSFSRHLFEKGYLAPLNDLSGLYESFTPEFIEPWTSSDGVPYGVPFMAVSHGIYYNIDLFNQLGLNIPTTWEELLTTAQSIQTAGYIPFANGSGDKWTIAELVFMNLAPTFIGGYEGRIKYLRGERCFNDSQVVSAFRAVADLAPFFSKDQEKLNYYDSNRLFLQGKAAMCMGGSWDISDFEANASNFEWSVFAIPAPAGQPEYVTFHADAAIGLNAASEHKNESRVFLEWLTTQEVAELLGNELPGFFPLHKEAPTLSNKHANAFLALNEGRGTDVRWAWPMLIDGLPDGYALMQNGAVKVLSGDSSPQEAADALQYGLAQWFEPAQQCSKSSDVVKSVTTSQSDNQEN